MRHLADDDGFTTGILFAGSRRPFMPDRATKASIADIERKFAS
jgi:hypothetical protein